MLAARRRRDLGRSESDRRLAIMHNVLGVVVFFLLGFLAGASLWVLSCIALMRRHGEPTLRWMYDFRSFLLFCVALGLIFMLLALLGRPWRKA